MTAGADRYTGLLLNSDVLWLDQKGFKWKVEPDGNGGDMLVIEGYPLCLGRFQLEATDILIRIPRGYNDAPLDMWWVSPALKFANGAEPVAASHYEHFVGRTWQRFSRHLSGTWKPGIDDVPRYMQLIAAELQVRR